MDKTQWEKISSKKLDGISVPRDIDFYENLSSDGTEIRIHINFPYDNMQEDRCAFEGWALILHLKYNCNIVLSFENINWDGTFLNLCTQQTHYMRFLYRVMKFSEFDWFSVDTENQSVIEDFKNLFYSLKENNNIINNIPNTEATVSKSNDRKTEHYTENVLVKKDNHLLEDILKDTKLLNVANQLPNGLFVGKSKKDVTNKTRIFPTGFFDIWGISENNEFCVIELKAFDKDDKKSSDNKRVGIISELFFYANFSEDVFKDKNLCTDFKKSYRDYEKLVQVSNKGITKIKAIFLAPEFHTQIEIYKEQIQDCLNSLNSEIEYSFVTYDFEKIKPYIDELKKSNR